MAGIQTYAGIELVRMGDNHRLVTTIYGAVAAIVTCYLWWPLIEELGDLGAAGPLALIGAGPVFLNLPLAIASIILVNRNNDPDATAIITA